MLTRLHSVSVICLCASISLLLSANAQGQNSYDYLPQDEVTSIEVEGKPMPVLVRPWEGKLRLGSVIIIGPSDSNADAAGFISHLRKSLNPEGWASISLTPPKGLYRPSFATAADEINKAGDGQLSVSAYKNTPLYNSAQLLELRNFQQDALTKSFTPLQALSDSYTGLKMYLVSDDSAGILVSLLFDKKIPAPDVLVLINPYREHEDLIDEASRRKSIAQQLLMQLFPVLDLQSPNGHPVSLADAKQRLNVNQIKSTRLYRQYRLSLSLDNPSGWEEAQNYIEGFARFATGR
ncbi:DUF3530 family protein [Shewanella sp.]|uniref:DUF3530 family protein n=1 Tax=Shewanella sp. TaxID=50422 RepID=UPI00405399F0